MLRMFIGSSSEANEAGLTPGIANALRAAFPGVEIRPWTKIFKNGQFALKALIDEAGQCDFAVLVFADDDKITSRNKLHRVTRDNVILEYGMFLSKIGPNRVAAVVQDGVYVPSDLAGLVLTPFEKPTPDSVERICAQIAAELVTAWGSPIDPANLGLDRTSRAMETTAFAIRDRIIRGVSDAPDNAIIIDTTPCKLAYEEALAKVQERFWTTSYLTSGFWTTNAAEVVQANSLMLERVKHAEHRSIRRLFLLPKPKHEFINDGRLRVAMLKERHDHDAVDAMLAEVDLHKHNVSRLVGCDTKVVHDIGARHWWNLQSVVQRRHRNGDTEVAIYDDTRVDFFSGGSKGVIDRVICITPDMSTFAPVKAATEDYFEILWREGEKASDFLDDWQSALRRAATAIGYTPQWIWKFDHALDLADQQLKDRELSCVSLAIGSMPRLPTRYLDVGACTARYPIALIRAGLLAPDASVIALDADEDCYDCIVSKLENEKAKDASREPMATSRFKNVLPVLDDFLVWSADHNSHEFDLITCMLGTLSHFGSPDSRGGIAAAVEAMSQSLAPNGLLCLGAWSNAAKRRGDFLDIYRRDALQLLAAWSPTANEIESVLRASGLQFAVQTIDDRLDVYVCRRPIDG